MITDARDGDERVLERVVERLQVPRDPVRKTA